VRTAEFQFELPEDLIAQHPAARRDASRLLVLHRDSGQLEHRQFPDLKNFLRAGDVLVLNDSRVIPARLRGLNSKSGGAFEILLLEEQATNDWWAMMKPGKRARIGTQIEIRNPKSEIPDIVATVTATNAEGHRRLRFSGAANLLDALDQLGEIPLPPYIRRDDRPASPSYQLDDARYQTVFARPPGSVAAPTAGLHFTQPLLEEIRGLGVEPHFVTLHVGLSTFAPVKTVTLAEHLMHEERYEVCETTALAVNRAKAEGRRVIAVGTTSVRVLESAAQFCDGAPASGPARLAVKSGPGRTKIFIHPPYEFKIVDALLTNFHLPCSTLLMLVSAFAAPGRTKGREAILAAYAEAIRQRYRFFSYGDAMLLL
jgi:S-adenosylmethionine:tRNA ribosyltransferase-isomerase